jgi:uncharacterized protein involved in exopolysaccharide biosynthesis
VVEIDEVAARVVRQYWALILVCVAIPFAAMTLVTIKQPPSYAADARIITGSVVPQSSAEADAIVSQVQGLATSRSAAGKALSAAHVRRNLSDFTANSITVSGLGSSQVVELTVTDRNPHVAVRVAQALAAEVTTSLNNVGQSGLIQALKAVDDQVVQLSQQRAALQVKAGANPQDQQLQAKLAGLDEVIANLTGDRGRLLAQASTQGRTAVIDTPTLPTHSQTKALVQKLGLAALLGLVVGILIASLAETIRPTVPGARRVSRRLGAPLLGRLTAADLKGDITPAIEDMALRIRLAADHARVSTVALADAGAETEPADLAAVLERALGQGLYERPLPSVSLDQIPLGHQSGQAANSHGPAAAGQAGTNAGPATSTLAQSHPQEKGHARPIHIWTLGQIDPSYDGPTGLVILTGPVVRVTDVAALADLAASSGWPVLGVIGLPRAKRGRRAPDSAGGGAAGRSAAAGPRGGGGDAGHRAERRV